MGLIVPPFAFTKSSHNFAATPSAASLGTSITTGASNADGSVASCLSALSFDVQMLEVLLNNNNTTATDTSSLIHIVIDPAGGTSWDTTNKLINNLLAGYCGTTGGGVGQSRILYFPVRIPAGATVGALGRNVTGATRACRVGLRAFGGLSRPELWATCDRVISIGDTAASSKGTTITPGNSGAAGSWTNVGSTTSKDLFGVVLAAQGIGSTTALLGYHIEVGINSTAIGAPLWGSTSTNEVFALSPSWPIFHQIPSGTQMQVRATCNGTADNIDVCLYGLG